MVRTALRPVQHGARARRYPCHRPGCAGQAVRLGGYCSRSCNRRWYLDAILTPEQKTALMRAARATQANRIRAERFRAIVQRRIGERQVIDRGLIYACMADAYTLGAGKDKTARYRQRKAAA